MKRHDELLARAARGLILRLGRVRRRAMGPGQARPRARSAVAMAGLALVFAWVACLSRTLQAGNIVYPWRATTAIVKAGESFPVWFVADPGQTVSAVTLQGAYLSVTAAPSAEVGSWVYDQTSGNQYNTRVRVQVPAGTPADRYDLVLHTARGDVRSAGAVKVVTDYAADYYILHLSDIHAFQHGNEAVLPKLSAIVEMANIIGPELVFVTGDNLYRPNEDKMDQFFNGSRAAGTKGLNGFSAATFVACGNHDYDMDGDKANGNYAAKARWYNRWWGLQAFHFSYGDGRFLVINNGWDGFNATPQIAAAQAWLQAVGPGNFRLVGAHLRSRWIDVLHQGADLKLALLGHNHHLAPTNPSPLGQDPIQYIANSIREHWEFNLFHVDGRTGQVTPVSGPTARVEVMQGGEVALSAASNRPNLTRQFRHPNDGTSAANEATLVSHFDFPLRRAKIRFVLPKGAAYAVSTGTVEQAFDGTNCRIVDVGVDVPAHRTVAVSIQAAAPPAMPSR